MPRFLLLILVNIALACASCTHSSWQPELQVKLQSSTDANHSTATAVDIVFVYDEKLVPVLPKTSGEWFAVKSVVVSRNHSALDVIHLEVPIGLPPYTIPLPARYRQAKYISSYTNYMSAKGQSPVNLRSFECVVISLEYDQPVYIPCH